MHTQVRMAIRAALGREVMVEMAEATIQVTGASWVDTGGLEAQAAEVQRMAARDQVAGLGPEEEFF